MKSPITIIKQLDQLKTRGLVFKDETQAKDILLQNNYYRLTGYWRKYQIDPDHKNDQFIRGITFEDVVEIYELDIALRSLLLEGIGRFEVCFRSYLAYHIAHSTQDGSIIHLKLDSYNNRIFHDEKPEDLLKQINTELKRSVV